MIAGTPIKYATEGVIPDITTEPQIRLSVAPGGPAVGAVERRTEVVLTAPQSTHRYVWSVIVGCVG